MRQIWTNQNKKLQNKNEWEIKNKPINKKSSKQTSNKNKIFNIGPSSCYKKMRLFFVFFINGLHISDITDSSLYWIWQVQSLKSKRNKKLFQVSNGY